MKKLVQLDSLNEQYAILTIKHYIAMVAYSKAQEVYKAFKEEVWAELGIEVQP